MSMIDILGEYRERFVNWKSIISRMISKKYPITCLLRTGKSVIAYNHKQLEIARGGLYFEFNPINKLMSFVFMDKRIDLLNADYNGDVIGVFYKEEYKDLIVNDKIVVDIGANIGDSAIYFAIRGAKDVIAQEPYPSTFKILTDNVKNNGYNAKIKTLNAGYGKDTYIKVNPQKKANGSTNLSSSDNGVEVPLLSLQTIIREYEINDGILKIDCEGCEYGILDEDPKNLEVFKQIKIEYHYGCDRLVDFLKKCGYIVTYTKPTTYHNSDATNPNMLLGLIFARK